MFLTERLREISGAVRGRDRARNAGHTVLLRIASLFERLVLRLVERQATRARTGLWLWP